MLCCIFGSDRTFDLAGHRDFIATWMGTIYPCGHDLCDRGDDRSGADIVFLSGCSVFYHIFELDVLSEQGDHWRAC